MRRILITGSNRGIGFDLVQRYLQTDDTLIFATCRHPTEANALQALAQQHPDRLVVLPLNVIDLTSLAEAQRRIGAQVDGLEMLINNAGIYPGGVADPELNSSAFGYLDPQAMLEVFQANSIAPIILAQTFADLLRRGQHARVINLSSDAGSITRRSAGCNYSYPASKAALNMMTRCLAGDFRSDKVVVISIHPGWIQTDMGGSDAPRTLAETMPSLIDVIDGLRMADSGTFLNWDGTHIAW